MSPFVTQLRATSSSGGESWESDGEDDNDGDDDDDREVSVGLDDNGVSSQRIGSDEDDNDDDDKDSSQLEEEYQKWIAVVNKTIKALQKKQKSLQTELEKAEQLQAYTARADLLKANLFMFTPGVRTATVQDWEKDGALVELTLDDESYHSATEEVEALYQQVRKLKRGSQTVRPLLEDTSDALASVLEMKGDLEAAFSVSEDGTTSVIDENMLRLIQDRLIRTSRSTGFSPPPQNDNTIQSKNKRTKDSNKQRRQQQPIGTPASNIRKLKSDAGCIILVGRNRRGNEHISLSLARGDDIWMHARGTPGAHVLVQQRRGGPTATDSCLQLAANLAAFYSDGRAERRVEVTAAEPKHVQKPRGAPLGAVKVREELRVLVGNPEEVPEELKAARAVSGLSDEYRATDKAKLRKVNRQQVAKQKQKAKQKAKKRKQKEAENFY